MAAQKLLASRTKLMKFINYLLIFCGQNIYYDNWYSKGMNAVLLVLLLGISVLGILEPFTEKLNMTKIAEFFELFGPYYQCLTKMIVHKYYMKVIRKLLKEMDDKFWPPNKFSEEIEAKKNKIFTVLYYCCAILYFGMLICGMVLAFWPLVNSIRLTPFACYKLYDYESHTAYWVLIYGIQAFNAVLGCTLVTAYDGVFLDFVSRFLIELMLLSEGLERLKMEDITTKEDEQEKYEKIKEYVIHHDMLLRMFNQIKKIYSIVLLNQFAASTATLCIGLYNMSTGSGTTVLIIRGLSFTGTFMFQLSMYCVAGSIIEYQCEKVSEYAFYAGWEAPCGRRLRNAVMMIIMRARRTPKLTAGDFMDANLYTFGKILQFSISFYTLMSKQKQT